MAYTKEGYLRRAQSIREVTEQHYEPGRQDRCLKWVWRCYIRDLFGVNYQTYLNSLRAAGFKRPREEK